ncbi:glycosyltransferase family 4 protein [Singulisphaera acidiphila]|uniref:Glycosyltransferase n=1 Tax=Singulisphaera acidiphila (strain ATCC BAA-1392 / DSM 18658 / VKM B-2454 / MOB10) TaxID=886293 RepID=L0DPA4_SINAD|nr:glycosyltransferase family 1 protein [Singulisphaera acidiphila]AGA30678.1 glycosyltransferase [Singulisphaera acidiphila DSM 18658]
MRLVIDGQRLTAERTGVGRCLESLLAEWALTGLPLAETLVVLRDPGGRNRVPLIDGLSTKVVGERWSGLAWEWFGLARELRPDDLLFAPANLVPWPWRGRTVLVIYDTLPWVVPESFPRLVRWRFGWRYRLAAHQADRILVPSQATAHDVARVHGVPSERIRVTYPGPEPEFRPLARDSPEVIEARRHVGVESSPYFLFVGKRSRRRNVPAILQAFASHRQAHPGHRLVFVGPDDPGDLPGPADGTIRAGHVAEPILRSLLAGAIALLYPSDYEGFGLPVVEALASGCPVVTLRNSALVEAGGDAPWYLDSADAPALAVALETLSTSEEERRKCIARGFDHVAQFSRSQFAREVKDELIRAASSSLIST